MADEAEASAPAAETSPVKAEAEASPPGPAVNQELAEIRLRHRQKFQEREQQAAEEERKREQEQRDAQLAEEYAKEEEEARLRQLEADEEYSRQLAAQLNPGGSVPSRQEYGGGGETTVPTVPTDDAELAAYYQQLEDGEAEGYRAPMRTNYMERLIESPQAAADLTWAWAMLQREDDARAPMVSSEPLTARPSISRARLLAVPTIAVGAAGFALLLYFLQS
ncbi:unnamed protein product [Durusdinium trenchii]|uniref:Uncharacterized protein n=2 Tax=Durusdinium trenchii TaxID=1381693 RepID=A0ABP0N1Y9_9DINO